MPCGRVQDADARTSINLNQLDLSDIIDSYTLTTLPQTQLIDVYPTAEIPSQESKNYAGSYYCSGKLR